MESDAPLDYVTFRILSQNRYETCIYSNKKEEKMGQGPLDQLLEHLPSIKDQLAKGSCDNFKLELPDNIDNRTWFTKATLTRFLHMIDSPDLLKKSLAIHAEMSQLEETRKFHLSLYAKVTTSDNSKNELLQAMDSRLGALTEELVSSFNLAAGPKFSVQEIINLQKFCDHFGDVDIRKLCKLARTEHEGTVCPVDNNKSPVPFISKNDCKNKTGNISGQSTSVKPIKYNASPAKAAQIERQSSTDSEDSSFSSEDDQPSAERSRSLVRSASPRRSASPMRRIQVGRSGSRRTPALTIKSLAYIPARERSSSLRDMGDDCKSEEYEGLNKKTEVNVTRMSVQDAISLFENKQRDQIADTKRRSLIENSTITNKAVLRRWSSGMGESHKSQTQNVNELVNEDTLKSEEVKPDMDLVSENAEEEETGKVDIGSEISADATSCRNQDDVLVSQAEETNDKLDSAEWNRAKEAELNQMLMKFTEFNQSNHKNKEPDNSKIQNSRSEKRGGFNSHYNGSRDEQLRGENARKRVDKQAEVRIKQKVPDKPKAEKSSVKISDVGKKNTTSRTLNVNKSAPMSSTLKKESPKPAEPKKASSKPTPLPATRKSWPSTPSPRATGTLPAKIPTGTPPSATLTPRQQKSQPPAPRHKPQSISRPSPKLERTQLQQKEVKKPQVDTKKIVKKMDDTKNRVVPKGGKTMKTKTTMASEEGGGITPSKAVVRKAAKKSSVVPLEAKPSTRKVSGINPPSNPDIQKPQISTLVEETLSKCRDSINIQESDGATLHDTVHLEEGDRVSETQNGHLELESELEIEEPKNGSEKEISNDTPAQGDEAAGRLSESPVEIQPTQEPYISPAAWVETSQHDPSIPTGDSCPPSSVNADVVASTEPRVRHSLSQMLLEESSEPDIIEWGNAENPPTMVYQKDAPKGLKRLLKFTRKNKGEANGANLASPYTSEGEDDGDEYRALGKRNSDNLLRKTALHSKNYGEGFLSDSEPLSARSNVSNSSTRSSSKFQEGNATSKGTRSFFSLSAFRGNKN